MRACFKAMLVKQYVYVILAYGCDREENGKWEIKLKKEKEKIRNNFRALKVFDGVLFHHKGKKNKNNKQQQQLQHHGRMNYTPFYFLYTHITGVY